MASFGGRRMAATRRWIDRLVTEIENQLLIRCAWVFSEGCSHTSLPYSLQKSTSCLRFYPSIELGDTKEETPYTGHVVQVG